VKIAVMGAGGVGGYFGGRLAQGGHDIHFVGRGPHLAAIRANGLRVRSVRGDFSLPPERTPATDDPASIGPCEVVLFTVKSFDTDTAAPALGPLLGSGTAVISLQNGIDNEEKLAAHIGAEHVVGGVAFIFAGIAAPGVIRDSGGPARILVGEFDGRRRPGRAAPRIHPVARTGWPLVTARRQGRRPPDGGRGANRRAGAAGRGARSPGPGGESRVRDPRAVGAEGAGRVNRGPHRLTAAVEPSEFA
jgi:ketopantoate reductase